MPFKKGSQEAREHMNKIRLKKGDPRLNNINKKPKEKGIRAKLKEIKAIKQKNYYDFYPCGFNK